MPTSTRAAKAANTAKTAIISLDLDNFSLLEATDLQAQSLRDPTNSLEPHVSRVGGSSEKPITHFLACSS
jgi:hypothetical protein